MSDQSAPTPTSVQQAYTMTCARIGELYVQIDLLERERAQLLAQRDKLILAHKQLTEMQNGKSPTDNVTTDSPASN